MNARVGLLMGELGCSQGDIAEALGIAPSTLSDYLSGYRKAPEWVKLRLAICERCAGLATAAPPEWVPQCLRGEMRRIVGSTSGRMARITRRGGRA